MILQLCLALLVLIPYPCHVEFPRPSGGVRIHHAVEWHSKHAILAVASKCEATDAEGSVNFYIDEVDKIIMQVCTHPLLPDHVVL